MEFKKNNTVILRIEDMSQDGLGIGKAEGYALFVKDTVIGDLAKVKILKTKKNYGFARLEELLEASMMDGCSDFMYYVKIVLPLSKAVIAVLVLFYGVGYWNAYFNAMIYLNDRDLYPLTIFLREILLVEQMDPATVSDPEIMAKITLMAGVIKYALIVVTMVPIMLIYPFIQKYFVKGVMIGSVKG